MNDVVAGGLAGCTATVPMTWTMDALRRRLPAEHQYPPPPYLITRNAARAADIDSEMTEEQCKGSTLLAHFGMGTTAGALYGLAAPLLRPLPTPLAGATYGLAVWAVNYLGIIPALGLLPPANRHPPDRVWMTVAAHLVWGGVLAVAFKEFQEGS